MLNCDAPPPRRRTSKGERLKGARLNSSVRRYRSRLSAKTGWVKIGLLFASKAGTSPPAKVNEPPKLLGLISVIETPRRRPPNFKACVPRCQARKFVISQRWSVFVTAPTCEPPLINELLTLMVGRVISPRLSERWRVN